MRRTSWGAVAPRILRHLGSLRGSAPPVTVRERESGQGLAEYALILSLIAIVAIAGLSLFGVNLREVFLDPIAAEISDVLSGLP